MEGQFSIPQMPSRYTNGDATAPHMYSNGPFNVTTNTSGIAHVGNMSGTSGIFPQLGMSTTTRNTFLARETVILDTSIVVNEKDRKTVDRVNFALVTIDQKVPLYTKKKIEDLGNAYRIIFNWEETWFIVSSLAVNTKLLNIDGVKDVQIGDQSIVVIVSKTVTTEDYGTLMQGTEDELTGSHEGDSGFRLTYKASDTEGRRILALVDAMCKNIPEAQRGLVLKAVREKIAKDTENSEKKGRGRNKKSKRKTQDRSSRKRREEGKGIRKNYKR